MSNFETGKTYTNIHPSGVPCTVVKTRTGVKKGRHIWDENTRVLGVWFSMQGRRRTQFMWVSL